MYECIDLFNYYICCNRHIGLGLYLFTHMHMLISQYRKRTVLIYVFTQL